MARILVIDDDSILNNFIAGTLGRKGHRVTSVTDGLEALGEIYSEDFDLAIIDLILPRIHGSRLLEALKKHRPRTMVIMISGQADLEGAIDSLRGGAYDFIKKPLKREELEQAVENALAESRLMKNSGYIYKDGRREDKSMIRKGVFYAAADSALVALSFYLALIGQSILFTGSDRPFLFGDSELIKMSLGLGFCYAFVFVFRRCHRAGPIGAGRELLGHLWRNITQAYIIFLAAISLGAEFQLTGGRGAIGIGYVLGFAFLYANRFFIARGFISLFGREGKKNIVVVGTGRTANEVSRLIRGHSDSRNISGYIDNDPEPKAGADDRRKLITSSEDIDRIVMTDKVEELYIAADAFSPGEILDLLDRFKDRNLKVVILGGKDDIFRPADVESPEF